MLDENNVRIVIYSNMYDQNKSNKLVSTLYIFFQVQTPKKIFEVYNHHKSIHQNFSLD